MNYDRDYSVVEIKKFIKLSEKKWHPWNNAQKGHGFSSHHGISDSDVVSKNKSAFIISSEMDAYHDNWDPARIGLMPRLRVQTVSDQPFMVAAILNSNFGQAALRLLNCPQYARMTIHAHAASTPGGAMKMRTASGGKVDSSNFIKHLVIIVDNKGMDQGVPYLHFVTAYPTTTQMYKFKIGPKIWRTRPGVELMRDGYYDAAYLWNKDDQTATGALVKCY